MKASAAIDRKAKPKADKGDNRMYDWVKSGARGNWDQFKQMILAPILVSDSYGKPVPIPITKSYSEGLDIGSYWAAMHGARMGTIGRVQGTMQPGMLSKQMSNVSMRQVVVGEDCGTENGVTMSLDDRDVLGRYMAASIKLGVRGGKDKGTIPRNTLIDTAIISRMKNNKIDSVKARSPLKCEYGEGICALCYGTNTSGDLFQLGTNVGIMAAHALGEPATQLSMSAFHGGGVVGARGTSRDSFKRLQQLLAMPKTLPGAAVLATTSGEVEKIDKDPAGGWNVMVKGMRHYVPGRQDLLVKKGQPVRPGESLSSGPKNPHELLERTNMATVQRYITDEIYDIYRDEGPVRKRNIETFVRSLTNLSQVKDPGDHPNFLPGDYVPTSEVNAFNKKLDSKKLKIDVQPVLKSVAMLPLELETDWVARMNGGYLKRTLIDAAAEGWQSRVHSTHPIPAMALGAEFGLPPKDKPWLY
jgi:DNA-directed RNA polymerase subunit beta'